MEAGSTGNVERVGCWSCLISRASGFLGILKKIAKDDPRRVIHSFKVALGLTLVSTFYYVTPMFKDIGESTMWAVLTVVLVMEFSVGAALSKGLNRTCATFLGGALGIGAHHLAVLFGEKGEPIVLGVCVFFVAVVATFARFIPQMKARYDYGVMIFILTFCLVTISSYREENVIELAGHRLSTIAIGVVISWLVSVFVCPVWAGEDLHRMTALNLEKLASFLQGLGDAYSGMEDGGNLKGKPSLQRHKSVLNSKSAEDTLANFARWEPGHGCFRFRHPWNQYLKVGSQIRRCAYLMETLNVYVTKSEFQIPSDLEVQKKLRTTCSEISLESSKAMNAVASAIRSMTAPTSAKLHSVAANEVADQLKSFLSNDCTLSFTEVLLVAPFVSILVEIVACTQQIVASSEELAQLAGFKSPETLHKATIRPEEIAEGPHVTIIVE